MDSLRVAVVGSGPAGIYAAAALTGRGEVTIDVIDRLPTPFGLVRYGVAPDHEKMKSVIGALRRVLEHDRVRFLGNVELGVDIQVEDLRRHYDAVVVANGAAVDRRMGVPGEELPGTFSATEFVAWYNGHPDADIDRFTLTASTAVVVGLGNVAIDVSRVLLKTADELRPTDVPDHVLAVLAHSRIRDVVIVGRRSAAYAKFTTRELREMGELSNADVVVDPAEVEIDPADEQALARNTVARRNLDLMREWSLRPPGNRPRRLHLRFGLSPAAVLGESAVTGLRVEHPDGRRVDIPADMVLRSVGYRGVPIPGLPFDDERGVIPNGSGRVLRDGRPVPGVYVAGWIKRGPSGTIGTNKSDAAETVRCLLADVPSLRRAPERDPDAVLTELRRRGVSVVPWEGWEAIDALEIAAGRGRGAGRVKVAERELMLAAALAQTPHRT
jgi:ferredoxin--NADP+ reductase